MPSTQLPRTVAGSTAALMFTVYQRFGPGVMTAEAEERNVGATGVPPPVMNAELELRKAICACAVLTSAMPASAPRSSKARATPRAQRHSFSLRVVGVRQLSAITQVLRAISVPCIGRPASRIRCHLQAHSPRHRHLQLPLHVARPEQARAVPASG